MIKNILVLIFCFLSIHNSYASKLSRFLEKHAARVEEREAREYQEDTNFADMVFRLRNRYTNDHGDHCRDYVGRSRSNPYRQGYFTVCDER